jgi:hypothetical protein
MADYTPQFNRSATGKFNPDLNFVSLKCGTDAFVLEDEMNELQWIQNEARANLVREITNSGCLDIANLGQNVPGGFNVLNNQVLNSFSINQFNTVINGYLVNVENPSKPYITVKSGNSIFSKTYRQDFIYLECWFSEIKEDLYDSNGVQVNIYGGVNNSTEPLIMADPRILGESARRIQLQWRICSYSKEYLNTSEIYSKGFVDDLGNVNINIPAQGGNLTASTIKFDKSIYDSQLFIAGNGSGLAQSSLNSIDGYVYAIPLFVVNRKINNLGYNATTNVNGGRDYVSGLVSDRPDGKFANIIYEDMITDVRYQAALGTDQYDIRYSSAELEQRVGSLETAVGTVASVQDDLVTKSNTIITTTNKIQADLVIVDGIVDALTSNLSIANVKITTIVTNTTGIISKIDVNTTSLTALTTNLATANANIVIIDTVVDALTVNLSTANSNINTINTTTATINTNTNGLNTKVDALTILVNNISSQVANNSTLNSKIDSIKTDIITYLDSRMNTIQNGQLNSNNALGYALNKLNDISLTVNGLETQLISIGADPALSQQIAYGVDIRTQQILTTGGSIQPDGSILAGGTSISVPYSNVSQYSTFVTPSNLPEGKIGDLWIEKNSSNVRIKNTGSSGIQCDIITVNTDNVKTYIGQSTFNAMPGVKITRAMLSTDFIVVTPLQNTYGDIGEIYITLLSDGFMVHNSGSVGNRFDWVVIDTTRLTNVSLEDINLAGLSGSSKNGQYGTNFKVLLSTPIGLPTTPGTLGDISITKATNNITAYNTGTSTSKVRCLMFKEVIQSEQQIYNFSHYQQEIYTAGVLGTNVIVPYYNATDYVVTTTLYSNYTTSVGDIWIGKNESNFTLYNSGASGTGTATITIKKEVGKVDVATFTAGGTTGVTFSGITNPTTSFAYIMPTSHNAITGKYFLSNNNKICNTANNTTDTFELITIDTTKLTNIQLINLGAVTNGATFTGSFGSHYEVIVSIGDGGASVPATIAATVGGEIWIEKQFDKFIVHSSGTGVLQFKALVLLDTTPYSFQMNKQTLTSNGSTGVSATVPFTRYTDYVVNTFGSGTLKTGIVDEWIEKADTNFVLKLAGTANTVGTSINTKTLSIDNYTVYRGEGTFSGATGTVITRKIAATDLVYIMPTQIPSATLNVGKIYITIAGDNNSFTVRNTGTSTTKFDWIVIDTTKLRNVELKTVPILGAAGSVVSGSGWGSNYDILVGTPTVTNTGMLFISQSLNTFTVYNEGATTGNVKCLVIKYS